MSISLTNHESNHVKVDVSKFPFVCVTAKPIQPTDEEMDLYMEHLDMLHSQNQPFVILTEFPQKLLMLKAKHRIRIGNWMKEHQEKTTICKATAFVMPNTLYKILMKGIFLIQSPVTEHKIFNDKEKAKEWLYQKMKENNIAFTTDLE